MEGQKIKCTVKDCVHNDTTACACRLNSITIDNVYDNNEITTEKDDTICNDFECKCGDSCGCNSVKLK